MISFCSFEGVRYFLVELCIFFISSYPIQPTNSCFASLKAIWAGTCKPYSTPNMNYWFQYCDLHWPLVKCQRPAEECTKNLGDTFHCRHTYIRSFFFFFNFIFPALIDNPNNFEIVRLVRLVVSGMFLHPSSPSLVFFPHFDIIPSKPSQKWTPF